MSEHMEAAIRAGTQGVHETWCDDHPLCEYPPTTEMTQVATAAITAALPNIRAMIAEDIRDHISTEPVLMHFPDWREAMETAAQIAAEGNKP